MNKSLLSLNHSSLIQMNQWVTSLREEWIIERSDSLIHLNERGVHQWVNDSLLSHPSESLTHSFLIQVNQWVALLTYSKRSLHKRQSLCLSDVTVLNNCKKVWSCHVCSSNYYLESNYRQSWLGVNQSHFISYLYKYAVLFFYWTIFPWTTH